MTSADHNSPKRVTVLDVARSFFERNACTIFIHFDNWLEPIGSGTIINVGSEVYVATAAHVIKDYPQDKIRIGNIRLNYGFFKILDWNWSGGDELEKHDQAWILVDFPTYSDRKGLISPVNLAKVNFDIENYFIVGYPEKLTKKVEIGLANRTIVSMLAYLTRLIAEDLWPESFIPTFDLVFDYTREHILSDGSVKDATPAPGISGGGIWMVVSPPSPNWSTSQLKLVGIQTEWNKSDERVFGIQIEQWIKLLITDRPQIRGYIEK